MANTLKTYPIRPAGGYGSANAAYVTVEAVEPGIAFQNGDVLVIDAASSNDPEVNNAATGVIFGVALVRDSAVVTGKSSIDRDGSNIPDDSGEVDTINVALAMPGQRWQGSMIQTGPADHTGVYADDIHDAFGLLESDATGGLHGCIDFSVTGANAVAYTLGYVTPQTDQSTGNMVYGREAGVGLSNPRVNFVFLVDKTVFGEDS